MRLLKPFLASHLLLFASISCCFAAAKDAPRSFSLSTSRTFSPGESVKIQLFARNVPELEFRVYQVRDPQKFFSSLKDPHTFGPQPSGPAEKIDERTWIERIHDFKAHLWWLARRFFRGQFTDEARDSFRESQAKLGKRSKVVGATEFARVPLLNESQLVARWKLETPPALVSETQQLPIDNLGAGVYLIEATDGTYKAYTVAIITSIALVERVQNGSVELYAADRKSGAPVADAEVALWADGHQRSSGKTGAQGMATLAMNQPGTAAGATSENVWILARHGADAALVTPWAYQFEEGRRSDLNAYIYTDRPVYRPGHTVHIKGVVRREKDDLQLLPADKTLQIKVTDSDNKSILTQDLPVSAHGTVNADLTLAADAGLGYYSVTLARSGVDINSGSFYVEEYKKPEYQVTVKPSVTRILEGNQIQAVIEARYFFGEPVANAKVKYVVHTMTHYWWDEDEMESGESADTSPDANSDSSDADQAWGATEEQEHEGILDANGRLAVTLPVGVDPRRYDEDYRIEARVTDSANREVSGHSTMLATYGSFRLSAEPVSYLCKPGEPVRVRISAVDYDSKPIKTAVHLAVTLNKWNASTQVSDKTTVTSRDVATGPDGSVLVDLPINASGNFEVAATARTPESRTVEAQTWVWVWNDSGEWYNPNTQARIVADKKSYAVGDTAHLLLITGLKESWALVTAEGDSVQSRQLLHSTAESVAFDVPITRLAQPNLVINAILVHDNQLITAQKNLKVPAVERTLTVTATPGKPRYLPGEKGSYDVLTVDSQGKPVEADLSFGAVDEALYSVRGDFSGDIVSFFYPRRDTGLSPQTSFDFFFSGEAGTRSPLLAELATAQFHPRLAQVKPGSDLVLPKVRKAFPDTAYWNPSVRTGPDGHARIEFNFPDSLTTWRTTIRAMTDDGKAGGAVTRVLTRKNLIVRLAAPRFFRQGDDVTLRVIAHNYLETAKDVTFSLAATGLDITGGQTQKINIPAKGESFVDWRVRARSTGNAVLTARALTNEESDALEMTLPVEAFGVRQQLAGAGMVAAAASSAQWNYSFPDKSDPTTRSLTLTVAPSVGGAVFEALDYLTGYPWGCTEQTMSSFLPDLIVAQAVDRLHLKSPIDRVALNDMVRAGLDRLNGYQHDDGGWGWWPEDQSYVFMTSYVVSGLGQARAAGYKIDEDRLARGRAWLVAQLAAHPNMIPDLRAYVVYALATTGGAPADAIDKVAGSLDKLKAEGVALAGLALNTAGDQRAEAAVKLLVQHAQETAGEAHWEGRYDNLLDDWGDNSPETTAFAVDLLAARRPASSLLPKAARWLAENRPGGFWFSTKQTAMVVYGLTRYLETSHELGAPSEVQVLVNGQAVASHHFGPEDSFAAPVKVQVTSAQMGSGGQITVKRSGAGVTYWAAEASWYSNDARLYHTGQLALNLTRDYFVLAKKQPKPTDPITYDVVPLQGPVQVGDIVAVRLTVNGTDWKYLLTEDPIPAGAEFLARTDLYTLNNRPPWWSNWFTRSEFHDDRAAFFQTQLTGQRQYFYLLKVVNPGKFEISPAQAGPMYQPGVVTTTEPATLEVQP